MRLYTRANKNQLVQPLELLPGSFLDLVASIQGTDHAPEVAVCKAGSVGHNNIHFLNPGPAFGLSSIYKMLQLDKLRWTRGI